MKITIIYRYWMVFIFFSSILTTTNSQSNSNFYVIEGEVKSENTIPVEIGNVLLLATKDSTLIMGDVFLDGKFKIENIEDSDFFLKISSLGFKDFYKKINLQQQETNLGIIELKSTILKGVEVVARKNVFEQKGGDLSVNVENTALSDAGTALDILRNTPKVIVNSSNQISVIGKGNALIYLDGQLIPSNEILENLSSNDLKAIEVLENPSAKYDAAGQAVINIITKKKTVEGYKIGMLQQIGHGKYLRGNLNFNTYYKISKFMFQTSYGLRPITYGARNDYGRTYFHNNDLVEIDNTYGFKVNQKRHTYNFKAAYLINQNSKIGIHFSGNFSDFDKEGLNKNVFDENKINKLKMNTSFSGTKDNGGNIVNLFFEKTLDTLGSNILLSGQYSNYFGKRIEDIHQETIQNGATSSIDRRTYNTNDINITSFQLDYNKVITSNLSIESGLKSAFVTNKSLLNFEGIEEGNYFLIPEFSSDYDYQENIIAGYSQVNFNHNSWSANIGLRGEWTNVEGVSKSLDNGKLFSKNYFDLFPSLSISKKLPHGVNTSFNYNYRIQRPFYQDLNPFTIYADSLVSFRGNPNLVPEYSHNFSGTLSYKKWTLGLNYNYTKDKINTIIEIQDLDEPAIFDFKRENTISTNLYSATISYPFQTKWYSTYNSITARSENHKYLDQGQVVSNYKSGIYLSTNHTFYLPSDFTMEINYWYSSKRVDGLYTDNPISALNLAVSRKFLNNSLTVRILGNNILDGFNFRGVASIYGNEWTYLSEGDYQYVNLSLNWSFGKLGTSALREKKISQEELNRISNQ